MAIGWQTHSRAWQLARFFVPHPRIAASEGGNSGRFSWKFHCLFTRNALFTGISGLAARKNALLPASAAPTALRSDGNCLPIASGICRAFFTPSALRKCRFRQCAEPPVSAVVATLWTQRAPVHFNASGQTIQGAPAGGRAAFVLKANGRPRPGYTATL